jgi:hypothetical protein
MTGDTLPDGPGFDVDEVHPVVVGEYYRRHWLSTGSSNRLPKRSRVINETGRDGSVVDCS